MCFEASIRVEFKIKVIHFVAIFNFAEGIELIRNSDKKLQGSEVMNSLCYKFNTWKYFEVFVPMLKPTVSGSILS